MLLSFGTPWHVDMPAARASRSILFDVVIAGSDTTASTTTAALYVLHLPENARWLERARDEAMRCGRHTHTHTHTTPGRAQRGHEVQ